MPRSPRIVALGSPHHITQRGNARKDVFVTDQAREVYLDLLGKHAHLNRLRIVAYCLMTNHVHVVAIPDAPNSLSNTFRHAHGRFAQYWNTAFGCTGHLWQNRFYSCPVSEIAVNGVVSYVELNPVRAGLVRRAEAYRWSSAAAHLGAERQDLLDLSWWRTRWSAQDWADILHRDISESEQADLIRRSTYNGRPLGSEEYIRDLERLHGRSLKLQKAGRPRKSLAAHASTIAA